MSLKPPGPCAQAPPAEKAGELWGQECGPRILKLNSLTCSCSYLAVHSSADAVRVLCRRGDQPSLRTALQVWFERLCLFVCLFVLIEKRCIFD